MPGWCGSRKVFDELAARRTGQRRTLAFDRRGYGQSASPIDDFGAGSRATDAIAVIEARQADLVVRRPPAHDALACTANIRKKGMPWCVTTHNRPTHTRPAHRAFWPRTIPWPLR
jgi:hypothetical protein